MAAPRKPDRFHVQRTGAWVDSSCVLLSEIFAVNSLVPSATVENVVLIYLTKNIASQCNGLVKTLLN